MTKKKENPLFDTITAINEKRKIKYDKRKANAYILLLWFSHSEELINIIHKIEPYIFILPDELIYSYLFKSIPKRKRFIKFTPKSKKDKELEEQIEDLCIKFNISKREAIQSL